MLTGFTPQEVEALKGVQSQTKRQFTYDTSTLLDGKSVLDYWPTQLDEFKAIHENAQFRGVCSTFAVVCMDKAIQLGFQARLVACYTETGEGHLICEVASKDWSEAYYFDNRRPDIVTLSQEVGYKFLGAGPWDPQPGDTRPWQLIPT